MSAVSTPPHVFLQLPSRALPTMGSTNSVCSTDRDTVRLLAREQDQQDSRGISTLFPFFSHIGYYSFFSRVPDYIQ